MNTQENNKLIAEFWGMELGDDKTMYYDDAENLHPPTPINELKFHSSWDWLMPVVEQCLEKHNNLIDGRDVIDTPYSSIAQALQVVSLKETYNAVVEFIKENN